MKTVFCEDCGKVVAQIESGSKLKKNCIMLCGPCNQRRKIINQEQNQQDFISKLIEGLKR